MVHWRVLWSFLRVSLPLLLSCGCENRDPAWKDSQNSIQMTAHIAVIVIISIARYYHEKDPLTKGANEKFLLYFTIACIGSEFQDIS